jgi:hypothetical protein
VNAIFVPSGDHVGSLQPSALGSAFRTAARRLRLDVEERHPHDPDGGGLTQITWNPGDHVGSLQPSAKATRQTDSGRYRPDTRWEMTVVSTAENGR